MRKIITLLFSLALFFTSNAALGDGYHQKRKGLNRHAKKELIAAGVTQYVGQFTPAIATDAGQGWTKHTYLPDPVVGPICIAGTPYSVFTKVRNPRKLLIFMQGGGACWQDFYNCNVLVETPMQEPPPPPVGIWAEDSFSPTIGKVNNPLDDWSVVYMPYCDGSVFTGDNTVLDPAWQAHIEGLLGLPPGAGPPVRFHRGLQNATAGIDVAKSMFPRARKIMVAGSSAGAVGAASFAPFLTRIAFGNNRKLAVFNDAGPNAINLLDVPNILARANDWLFGQFFPKSCTDCDAFTGQGTAIVKWRLDNDRTIRESFYSTDGDTTNRFFLNVPTQELYRDLIVSEHGKLNAAHPLRYKRFIRSGSTVHTGLQLDDFYLGTADGVPLNKWVKDFVKFKPLRRDYYYHYYYGGHKKKKRRKGWVDIVEDFVPVP